MTEWTDHGRASILLFHVLYISYALVHLLYLYIVMHLCNLDEAQMRALFKHYFNLIAFD